MPEAKTVERAKKARRRGKAPSTAAGEFVREEIEHVREGKHGARSAKQAIAIGLSKARRAGIPLRPPKRGSASARTRRQAERDRRTGRSHKRSTSPKRSRASSRALRREGHQAASKRALSAQARRAAAARRASKNRPARGVRGPSRSSLEGRTKHKREMHRP